MLTDKQITKFQEIYRNRFGKEISQEDVLDRGVKLVRLIQIIYKPITKEEFNQFQTYGKLNKT